MRKHFNFQQQNTNLSLREVIDGLCYPSSKQQQSVQEFVVFAKLKSLPLAHIQYEGSKSPGEVLPQGQLYQGFLISIAQGFSKPFFLGLVTCRDDC